MEQLRRRMKLQLRSLLLLLSWFLLCSPGLATPEEGQALQEVISSGWITKPRPTWKVGTDPCTAIDGPWEGIDCNTAGNVILLNLTNAGLKGPVPPAVGRLTALTTLDMGNNKIPELCKNCSGWNKVTGDLAALATLGNLQILIVTSNELGLPNGPFPLVIFKLKKLVFLYVDNTQIGGPFPVQIATLTNLQKLYLGNNSFGGTVPANIWSSLPNLQELTMWGNGFTGLIPPELGNIPKLTYLNLAKNKLYGGLPPELGKLTGLKRLLLYKNKFTGPIPESWRAMNNLTQLELSDNALFGGVPSWLLQLPRILNVSLSDNKLRDSLVPNELNNRTTPSLMILRLSCNYMQGKKPTVGNNITAELQNNCWDGDQAPDSVCSRTLNCLTFLLYTSNGKCPDCPEKQHLVNSTTCVCWADAEVSNSGSKIAAIIGGVVGAVFLLLVVAAIFWWRARRKEQEDRRASLLRRDYFQTEKEGSTIGFSGTSWETPGGVQLFTMEELMKATKNFDNSNQIGEGGFGKVFVGYFPAGRTLAIKRAGPAHYSSESGHGQFRNEVFLLSRLHHKNLVRLEGFCDEGGQQILVYEFMKFGNLDTHLHGNIGGKHMVLDWYKRLEIAVNVAQGLDYLHSFAEPPVIHRDVKPSNILLDDNFVAKVADFGISKESPKIDTHVSTRLAGTAGYFDPQYFLRRQLTTASDVYSFGVVLLELITGRKAIQIVLGDDEESNIIEWVHGKMQKGQGGIESIADPRLEGNYPRDLFVTLVDLALECASFKREARPTMKAVVSTLEPLLQGAEKPPQNNLLQLQPPRSFSSTTNSTGGAGMSTARSNANSTGRYTGSDEEAIRSYNLETYTRIAMETEIFPR